MFIRLITLFLFLINLHWFVTELDIISGINVVFCLIVLRLIVVGERL